MKHWPIFEPFEEAADTGRFLALWPSIIAAEPEEMVPLLRRDELERRVLHAVPVHDL